MSGERGARQRRGTRGSGDGFYSPATPATQRRLTETHAIGGFGRREPITRTAHARHSSSCLARNSSGACVPFVYAAHGAHVWHAFSAHVGQVCGSAISL